MCFYDNEVIKPSAEEEDSSDDEEYSAPDSDRNCVSNICAIKDVSRNLLNNSCFFRYFQI